MRRGPCRVESKVHIYTKFIETLIDFGILIIQMECVNALY